MASFMMSKQNTGGVMSCGDFAGGLLHGNAPIYLAFCLSLQSWPSSRLAVRPGLSSSLHLFLLNRDTNRTLPQAPALSCIPPTSPDSADYLFMITDFLLVLSRATCE